MIDFSEVFMVKVSVIIPLYNGKKYILQTLQSVFNQSFTDYEVVVVDDGSNDHPEEILEVYKGKIKFISQKNSGCPAGAKNTGIKHAQGKFLAFLDQDDLWGKDKLKSQVSILENDEKIVMVASNIGIVDGEGKKLVQQVWPNPELWKDCDLRERLAQGNIILTSSSVMIRRDFIDKSGFFNEKLLITDDFEMWYRAARFGKIYLMPEILTFWRMHGGNTSKMSEKTRVDTAMYYEELVKDKTLNDSEKIIADNWLKTMKIRLANYYLVIGRVKEALEIYQRYGLESKAVGIILKLYKLNPHLARMAVRLKIYLSENVLNKLPRKREIIFPGGGVI